ncbi:uncharacterized protein UV8b_00135 [Ustilaginoidea virens]|uniref:Uncharacterized protein n=1 Tax=Ustilaginoidea virens TaxID=1159556 RepID=A0A8E5HIA0_USTVR|nr:uncharacterized protein UV8b_00135 [Ustilaginoidea virens]QUC15894.1 hypothetical protein UV8b_00135 [Ustilaginoidea virens]
MRYTVTSTTSMVLMLASLASLATATPPLAPFAGSCTELGQACRFDSHCCGNTVRHIGCVNGLCAWTQLPCKGANQQCVVNTRSPWNMCCGGNTCNPLTNRCEPKPVAQQVQAQAQAQTQAQRSRWYSNLFRRPQGNRRDLASGPEANIAARSDDDEAGYDE